MLSYRSQIYICLKVAMSLFSPVTFPHFQVIRNVIFEATSTQPRRNLAPISLLEEDVALTLPSSFRSLPNITFVPDFKFPSNPMLNTSGKKFQQKFHHIFSHDFILWYYISLTFLPVVYLSYLVLSYVSYCLSLWISFGNFTIIYCC